MSQRIGGLERHARDVSEGLVSRGHHVEVWTTAHPDGKDLEVENGVTTRYFADTKPTVHSPEFRTAVKERLHHHAFDVLLSESSSAATAITDLHPPARPPAVAMEHGTVLSEATSVIAADRGLGKWARVALRVMPRHLRDSREEGRFLRACERVLCVSGFVASQIDEAYGVSAERLRVVRNGIPLPARPTPVQKEEARDALGIPKQETVLLCIGRLAPDKGFDLTLEAFASARGEEPSRMLIVGSGPEEGKLRTLVDQLGLGDHVTFIGPVSQKDVAAYYTAADILLLASVRYEGHPYVLIEGAVPGLAVIASDRGGLGSELAGGDLAILVRPGSVYDVTDAMRRLLTQPDLRKRLGNNLRSHAERFYTLDAMLDGIEQVMEEAVAAGTCSNGR